VPHTSFSGGNLALVKANEKGKFSIFLTYTSLNLPEENLDSDPTQEALEC